jgi:hypothetical protein
MTKEEADKLLAEQAKNDIQKALTDPITVPESGILAAIETGEGALDNGCAVDDPNKEKKKSRKVQTSKVANEVVNAAGAIQQDVAEVADTLLLILNELTAVTDCEALKARLRPTIKTVTDAIDGVIDEMEKQSGLAAIAKVPKTPPAIIKWIKKFVLGTVLPQIKAFIKLAKEIIRLIKILKQLIQLIKGLEEKLKACAVEFQQEAIDSVIGAIEKEINEAIDEALGPLFCKIQKLQADIDDALGVPTTAIDFSSTDAFIESTTAAMDAKDEAAQRVINEPIFEVPGATGTTTDPAGNVLEFKDGQLVKITPA